MVSNDDVGVLGIVIGLLLVVIPDPATTLTGLAIVAAAFGVTQSGE